jgi:hypothetical protein
LLLGFFFILIISKFTHLTNHVWRALGLGLACALFYVLSGFFTLYHAANHKQVTFNRIFTVSLGARYLLILGMISLIIKTIDINQEIFIISLIIWYFVFQILEIISLNKLFIRKV